ncbi:hypothetical protein A3A46_00305 [Candidatus Roizmanbacteria bacterium RIFCSPLOWO2_01_FULL_37_13]|uniref:Uncharacterized protein n=1 Tax=Candidatus Roizmanbacteria bacterium RIFCSPHIGHO2_02_FULL_38_11 TaxID=1802039 RepID=A0A1F7H344_9BACT|nr:MAG: hypothetical protein A3C25_02940 [Candidatus Roizmanbacteria bacterium RIFCSPHIGHO2_02_FULL_38_11]OGK34668.1 MAG: hypothetical protein A3F58_03085 [Candidatus Roizmanbacteria bacterium RIFCSPHIGHO2_12_FULL_37_9b]OGK42337.1 MAG: hypothetical protein A3A46_00305 [Candidatus Roizmanbacteria bacterium RIFCSPLOWO2_01_FULL_37_13]
MQKLIKWLSWFDDNLVKILAVGFIFLIPLYPKFPLKFIDYTYIAIRLEDLYVAFLTLIFVVQLLRRKILLNKQFLLLMLAFWGAVMLSFFWGAFIQKTIIYKHLGFLHAIRRIEYSLIFFIITSTIKSRKDFLFYFSCLIVTLVIVSVYALGQKFLGWPAVQTMNPEFAKGYILYLTPEARVSSTFSGHYDLAAYLVFLLPIALGAFFWRRNLLYFLIFTFGLLILTLTASRSSSLAYLISITTFLIFIRKFKTLFIVITLSVGLSFLTNSLASRWAQFLRVKQIYVNEKTGQVVIPQKITTKELPAGTLYLEINREGEEKTNAKTEKLVRERILDDIRDEARKSGKVLTASQEAQMLATISAGLKPISTVVSDISFSTRIQVEWPRAINAFLKNPILGSGPSSITEATDGDYFRWLGEFGLLGTSIFSFFILSIVKFIWQKIKSFPNLDKYIYYGYLFGLFGLLINASYIDVFEASKVAYTFWTVNAIIIGSLETTHPQGVK